MNLGLLFWILVLLWFILGGFERWGPAAPYWGWSGWLLQFLLICILGWQVFGPFIKR